MVFQLFARRLSVRVFASISAFVLIAIATLGVAVDRNVQASARREAEDRLSYESTMLGQMMANALFGPLDDSDAQLQNDVHALGDSVKTRLALVTAEGKTIADSQREASPAPEPTDAAELVAAKASGLGAAERDGRVLVARSIVRDGKLLGFARSSVPVSEIQARAMALRARFAWGAGLAAVGALVVGAFLARGIVRPIRHVADAARRIGSGDFGYRVDIVRQDEIGDLARDIGEMSANLKKTMTQLDDRNGEMRLVLDNVSQGLLTVEADGTMSAERSAAVAKWLGPAETRSFAEYAGTVDASYEAMFAMGLESILEDVLPIEVNVAQLPSRLRAGPRVIEVSYQPLFDGKRFARLLVVMSDVTEKLERERKETEQREVIEVYEQIAKNRVAFARFFADAETLVRQICGPERRDLADERRWLHTLKGNCGMFKVAAVASAVHELESASEESGELLTEAQRDDLAMRWERFDSRVGASLRERERRIDLDLEEHAFVLSAIERGAPHTDLARRVALWRHPRLADALQSHARQAKELGRRLDKDVEVRVEAGDLRASTEAWASVWSNLSHVVRNAIDHGIETPGERRERGKNPRGLITFGARRSDDAIILSVEDDGRGIDWERVRQKAEARGLPSSTQSDLFAALCADGLSTRDVVTETSGRGVGMGALLSACAEVGGKLSVDSTPGRGTRVEIALPNGQSRRSSLPPRRASVPAPASC
jgi:two-component system chemotaxis sensor kinase CheA